MINVSGYVEIVVLTLIEQPLDAFEDIIAVALVESVMVLVIFLFKGLFMSLRD